MITQHVVSYGGDITLTRLPAGRADGFVWLFFVARGIEQIPGSGEGWRIREHIKLTWLDGSAADVAFEGRTGEDSSPLFDVTVRDAGYNTLTIRYIEDGRIISTENVALPVPPAA
ncbi:hypothetical protein [Aeromicrobium sp.]|uniref:hypothetical protein n=1 Tax=Aeromicrobium sp. TaxID=1871063 RepID=UPI002FC7AD21